MYKRMFNENLAYKVYIWMGIVPTSVVEICRVVNIWGRGMCTLRPT